MVKGKRLEFDEAREFERELLLVFKDANLEKVKYAKYSQEDNYYKVLRKLDIAAGEAYLSFKELVKTLREEKNDEQQEEVSVLPQDNSNRGQDDGPNCEEHNGVQRMGVL